MPQIVTVTTVQMKHYIEPYFIKQSNWCVVIHSSTIVNMLQFIWFQGGCMVNFSQTLSFQLDGYCSKYIVCLLKGRIFLNVNI